MTTQLVETGELDLVIATLNEFYKQANVGQIISVSIPCIEPIVVGGNQNAIHSGIVTYTER